MNDENPHSIEDKEPTGEQTNTRNTTERYRISTVTIEVGFDENQKEFKLWDYLYDVKTKKFELEAITDYDSRIQYYQISAGAIAMQKLRLWLMRNNYKYRLDK